MNPVVLSINPIGPRMLDTLAFAAKICYGREEETLDDKEKAALLTRVLNTKHFSILEHASASFYITGVSRNFTHQLVRHRHMSFAQQSLHYTVAKDKSIASPKHLNPEQQKLWDTACNITWMTYTGLVSSGIPKEDARHILPSGIATRIVATANLREWVQFINIRACYVNCDEVRIVARQIRDIFAEKLPFMSKYLGPTCFTEHVCNEGIKCCGKPHSLPCTVKFSSGNEYILSTFEDIANLPRRKK